MTTLTPEQRAARRRRRRLATFVLLPGVAVGSLGVTTAYAEGWINRKPVATCEGQVVRAPSPKSFTVDVLSATYRPGTAGTVSTQVAKHGFVVGTVGNDDALRTIYGQGEVRYAAKSLDEALYVQKALLPGARLVEDDTVLAHRVELVLGKDFTAIQPLPPRPPAQAGRTTVNVYNTTYYEGLAKKVSDEMTHRGFKPGEVGADPQRTWQQGTALIRYGENGDLNAKLVAQHVPGATLQQDDRTDTSVDIVIGMKLTDLSRLTPLDEVPPQPRYVPPSWPTITRPCD